LAQKLSECPDEMLGAEKKSFQWALAEMETPKPAELSMIWSTTVDIVSTVILLAETQS